MKCVAIVGRRGKVVCILTTSHKKYLTADLHEVKQCFFLNEYTTLIYARPPMSCMMTGVLSQRVHAQVLQSAEVHG